MTTRQCAVWSFASYTTMCCCSVGFLQSHASLASRSTVLFLLVLLFHLEYCYNHFAERKQSEPKTSPNRVNEGHKVLQRHQRSPEDPAALNAKLITGWSARRRDLAVVMVLLIACSKLVDLHRVSGEQTCEPGSGRRPSHVSRDPACPVISTAHVSCRKMATS